MASDVMRGPLHRWARNGRLGRGGGTKCALRSARCARGDACLASHRYNVKVIAVGWCELATA